MPASRLTTLAAVAAGFLLLAAPTGAAGQQRSTGSSVLFERPWSTDGSVQGEAGRLSGRSSFSAGGLDDQHGGNVEHLPSVRENIDLVGKLRLDTPDQYKFDPVTGAPDPSEPDLVPGQIADVAVYKTSAYLNSWSEPSCKRGGFFSVDISDPANPRQLAFVPALGGSYHGEGAHVITVDTPSFKGDLLAVNNEICDNSAPTRNGGFDLYDVTDPSRPKTLVQGAGDPGATETGRQLVNSYHSSFLWQDGGKAYLVATDNQEGTDVDVFDVTNPAAPVQVGDYDLDRMFPAILGNTANGQAVFNHDMVVKEIGGVQTMLVSYWDAGYVALNVEDPAAPTLIRDSDFAATDPETGASPPEGNGHQSEFSHDSRYVLAADEDFSPFRIETFRFTTGANQGVKDAGEFGFTRPIGLLPDKKLNGPTIYGGYGCDADDRIPNASTLGTLAAGEERILVVQRGPVGDPNNTYEACRFDEKIQNAIDKGYDAVIIGNRHSSNGESVFCGGGEPRDAVGVCVSHNTMHALFNRPPDNTLPYPAGDPGDKEPNVDDRGEKVEATDRFDGWGYAHLYENSGGKMRDVDTYAIEEGIDERFAAGFGDLSIHEWATDATENIAYSSYYAGGMRVVRFGEGGIEETGKFIDRGGNNFWGVEQFTTPQGDRLFAGSDRDSGLYLFRYTGPGAAAKPVCADQNVTVPFETAVTISLTCTDANNNPLTRRLTSTPSHGTASGVDQGAGTVTYTPAKDYGGPDSFTFTANDGAATSNQATVRITVTYGPRGCRNVMLGTAARDLIAGTEGSDRVNAGAGDDVVDARNGDDCVFGESGGDVLDGEGGNDVVDGSTGPDRLIGSTGADLLTGGDGVDRADGDEGNDRISGGAKRDILAGGAGADALFGGTGKDTISGGAGNDRISGGSSADRIYGNAGSDRITPGKGGDRVIAAGGNDRISARDRTKDRISCGSGRDRVTADRVDVLTGCERVSRR